MSAPNPLLAEIRQALPRIPVVGELQQSLHGKHILSTLR